MPRAETNYDLIVLGCGAAGLSAAVSYATEAAVRGRSSRIAVLERAARETRGGANALDKLMVSYHRIEAPNASAELGS